MTAAMISSLALGDSLLVDGDLDGAIESYTAAICLTNDGRKKNKKKASSPSSAPATEEENDVVAATTNADETKRIRFRSLSHRSETHLLQSKFPHAYNDATAALALFPPSESVDDDSSSGNASSTSTAAAASAGGPPSTSSSSSSSRAIGCGDLAMAHDRIARASVGLAKANMGVGGRSRATGRTAFVRLASPGMGDVSEMIDEARDHWESALVLAVRVLDDGMKQKRDDDDGGDGAEKEKGGSSAAEGRRLAEKFRKALKKLDGGDDDEEEEGDEAKDEKEEAAKEASDSNPMAAMMGSMMANGGGNGSAARQSTAASESAPSTRSTKKAKSSSSPPAPSSAPSPPARRVSDHPASARRTSPVDRGVMSGMPKYQYYQDDNFMKVQILEPNVRPENLTAEFTPDEITVKIRKGDNGNGALEEYTVIRGDLYEEVVAEKCRAIIKEEKVLIKLRKKEAKIEWNKLLDESKGGDRKKGRVEKRAEKKAGDDGDEGEENDANGEEGDVESKTEDAENSQSSIPTVDAASAKTRPYASHRDWDAIDRNLAEAEKSEKPEGDEALNTLFQQIYRNANEDTRRAMVKSMQTSGGTCLSTNWDEVEKTDYEKDRQAPKGMEWKDSEGRKLPMKEDD